MSPDTQSGAKITALMTVPDILTQYPQTLPVFKSYGLNPEGYMALQYENLNATSRVHQLPLEALLQELNSLV